MYDSHHPSMESYFNRFPARQYSIDSEGKHLFLRFAACFGQFLMASDFQIVIQKLCHTNCMNLLVIALEENNQVSLLG